MRSKNARRALVTGASGFAGAHIALSLAEAGFSVTAVAGSNPVAEAVGEKVGAVVNLNLSDQTAVCSLVEGARPQVIVHAAALANAQVCETNPRLAHDCNVAATQNLLQASSCPFVHFSTDLVFDGGEAPEGGFDERANPCPLSVYGKTKREAELRVCEHSKRSVVLRVCLMYGPPLGSKGGFMNWLLGSLKRGEEVKLFIDEWRTAVYMLDVCHTVQRIAEGFLEPESVFGKELRDVLSQTEGVLHVGGERMSRADFGLLVASAWGFKSGLIRGVCQSEIATDAPRPRDVSLSSEALSKLLGRHAFGTTSFNLKHMHQRF